MLEPFQGLQGVDISLPHLRAARLLCVVQASAGLLLGALDKLLSTRLRLGQQLASARLGSLDDLRFAEALLHLRLRLLKEPGCFLLREADHLIPAFQHITGVVDFTRHGHTHAIDHIQEPLAGDNEATADGQASGVRSHLLQAVYKVKDIHFRLIWRLEVGAGVVTVSRHLSSYLANFFSRALPTCVGTSSPTS